MPLYYISAEKYSKKNASGFDAQRNCFHCSSKPLSSAIEAAWHRGCCPHDRGRKKSCLFTYLFSLSIGILDDVDLSALHLLAVDATAQTVVNSHYLKTLCSRSRDTCRCKLQLNTIGWTAFPKASCGTYCIGVGAIQWSRVNIVGRCAGGNLDAVSIHVVSSDIVGTAAQDFRGCQSASSSSTPCCLYHSSGIGFAFLLTDIPRGRG